MIINREINKISIICKSYGYLYNVIPVIRLKHKLHTSCVPLTKRLHRERSKFNILHVTKSLFLIGVYQKNKK